MTSSRIATQIYPLSCHDNPMLVLLLTIYKAFYVAKRHLKFKAQIIDTSTHTHTSIDLATTQKIRGTGITTTTTVATIEYWGILTVC